MEWSDYWVWFAAAIVLGILEILAPGYILLGVALAAAVVGAGFWIGGGLGAFLAGSLPVTLVIFAAIAVHVTAPGEARSVLDSLSLTQGTPV